MKSEQGQSSASAENAVGQDIIPRPSATLKTIKSKSQATPLIRGKLTETLRSNDPETVDVVDIAVYSHLTEGIDGQVAFDHSSASGLIMECESDYYKQFKHLTKALFWKHLQFVLKDMGYQFENGYIVTFETPELLEHKG